MSKEKIKKIHLIYGCITALLVVIVGIALIVSCVNIYRSGDRPFSREVVALAFSRLAIPGVLCLLAVIGGIVLRIALPEEPEKAKALLDHSDLLKRYASKFGELTAEYQKKVQKEITLRRILKICTALIITALAIYPVLYFSDVSHFGVTDINGDILTAVLVALIPTAAALILVYLCGLLCNASKNRQIEIYKSNSVKPDKVTHRDSPASKYLPALRCVMIGAAVALIILGIANDGVADVLGKAIRICTECIGLG